MHDCEVCAVPRSTVDDALCTMPGSARVISLDPSSVGEMIKDLERLAAELDVPRNGAEVAEKLRERLAKVESRAASVPTKPRVFCAEWLDPIFCAGHWLPEMVAIAGGKEGLGRPKAESVRLPWSEVLDYDPEVIVLTPCGFDAQGALAETGCMTTREGWSELTAVREGNVFVVDANSYFARPGPRLIDGMEILARLLHPTLFESRLSQGIAFKLKPGSLDQFELYT